MATLPLPHKDLGDDRLWQVWGCILEASQQVEGWIGSTDVRDKSSFKSKDSFHNLKAPIGPIKSALLLTEAMGLLEAENDLQQKFALTEAGRALASQDEAAAQRAFRAHLAELWFAKLRANSFDEFFRAIQQQRSDASQEESKAAWSMLEAFALLSAEPTASAEPIEPRDAQPAPTSLSEALGTAREAEQAEPTQASAPAEQPQAAQREDDKPEQEAQQPTLPEKVSPEQTQSREPAQPAIDPPPPIPSRGSRLKARPSLQQGAESDPPTEGVASILDMNASPLAAMRRSAPSSDAASEQAEDHVRPTLRGRLRKEDLPETTAPNANRIGPSAPKPSETTESLATPSAPRGGRLGPRTASPASRRCSSKADPWAARRPSTPPIASLPCCAASSWRAASPMRRRCSGGLASPFRPLSAQMTACRWIMPARSAR